MYENVYENKFFILVLVQGQDAVAAKRKEAGKLPEKRMLTATVTSGESLSPPAKMKRGAEDNPPNNVLQIIQEFGRPVMREWIDKLSQVNTYQNML